jgi:FlaA1/EpsC-like NDP-sugar epimerase
MWAYASVQELKIIVTAVTLGSVLLAATVVGLVAVKILPPFPRGIFPIDWLLSLVFVGGLRFSLRLLAESRAGNTNQASRQLRVLVIGAGDGGALVVREMQKNPNLPLTPVCFLDDDPIKQKQQIHGVPVVGTLDDLGKTVVEWRIDEVIVAIPSAPGAVIRKIANLCHDKGLPFKTMPGLYELLGGKVSVSRLREVEITDLLRREPAKISESAIGLSLAGKRVLITGAGGSIGRELCRQVARWGPAELILLGHGENSIFESLLELQENYPTLPVHSIIADVRDRQRLNLIYQNMRPQVVFHTAAHKHVPLMEVNVEEALTNNIMGTRNVVDCAVQYQVDHLVMVSTDKAIRPTSIMGASKRIAEMIVLDAANHYHMSFSVVRFGNVLGSRGSVIPLFKRQIARGGPITITHPDMKRYFMTIPEAVLLVLQASAMGKGGEVFVLNMGDQVSILELAEDLIRLSGLEPGKDIEIEFTGIRPGEKLSEELWDAGVSTLPTGHPDIALLKEDEIISGDRLKQLVEKISQLAYEGDTDEIIRLLDDAIPGAAIRSMPPPELTSVV